MNARQHAVDRRESCPNSFVFFLGFLIVAYGPGQKPAPSLRADVDMILSRASRTGFAHVDILTTMIANGERDTLRVRQLATVLGEHIGDADMIGLIQDLAAKIKANTQ
ncbi:hypothetical protein AAKU55_003170 [Oxalobacteraceae bacterium GrIS 1.11]